MEAGEKKRTTIGRDAQISNNINTWCFDSWQTQSVGSDPVELLRFFSQCVLEVSFFPVQVLCCRRLKALLFFDRFTGFYVPVLSQAGGNKTEHVGLI